MSQKSSYPTHLPCPREATPAPARHAHPPAPIPRAARCQGWLKMRKSSLFVPALALLSLAATAPALAQNADPDDAAPPVAEAQQPPEQAIPHVIAVADFTGADPSTGKFVAETLL